MRYSTRRLGLALALVVGVASAADARVASLTLDGLSSKIPGRYMARGTDSAVLYCGRLTMASVDSSVWITFRLYVAVSNGSDTVDFTMQRSWTSPYRTDGKTLEDQAPFYMLDSLFREMPGGKYLLYMTADDGEGECAPSNALPFELAGDPGEVLDPIQIERAFSPASGIVILQLAPIVFRGEGRPTVWYSVYRADGDATSPDDFEPIPLSRYVGMPKTVLDTGDGTGAVWRELSIAGLASGRASFYVAAQLEPIPGRPMITSGIVTVDVAGDVRVVESIFLRLSFTSQPTAVRDEQAWRVTGATQPNLY